MVWISDIFTSIWFCFSLRQWQTTKTEQTEVRCPWSLSSLMSGEDLVILLLWAEIATFSLKAQGKKIWRRLQVVGVQPHKHNVNPNSCYTIRGKRLLVITAYCTIVDDNGLWFLNTFTALTFLEEKDLLWYLRDYIIETGKEYNSDGNFRLV